MKSSQKSAKVIAVVASCYALTVLAFAIAYGGSVQDERAREENETYRRLAENGTKHPVDPTNAQRNAILYAVSQDLKENTLKELLCPPKTSPVDMRESYGKGVTNWPV